MAYVDTLVEVISDTLDIGWNVREGKVVPKTEDIVLKDGAVKIEATFLYADLAGSSKLAQLCPWNTTAKIIRAYLECAVRLIRVWGGHIRSFDGDRVMGVFVGDTKNTHASFCAREIDYMVYNHLNPKARAKFTSVASNDINIRHCVGLDTGECHAVRAGIRDNNDIIWIGKAPSFAAKLSDIRSSPREVFISSRVYGKLRADAKIPNGENIWQTREFNFAGTTETVYSTTVMKCP